MTGRRRAHPLRDRIAEIAPALSPGQTKVARLVEDAPSVIAFGTVAEVASEAETSPQTVLRLAARLGHDGFAGLQSEVRGELVARLPPAAARIRQRPGSDLPGEVQAADEHNLGVSLDLDPATLVAVVDLLADPDREVAVLAADSWVGVGTLFAGHLSQLRDGVRVLDGPVPRVARQIAMLGAHDVVVALHGYGLRRRWTELLLGGTNRPLAAHLARHLRHTLPAYRIVDDVDAIPLHLRGQHPDNPCNRPRLGGVQIELPPRVRGLSPLAEHWPARGIDTRRFAHTQHLIDGLARAALAWEPDGALRATAD